MALAMLGASVYMSVIRPLKNGDMRHPESAEMDAAESEYQPVNAPNPSPSNEPDDDEPEWRRYYRTHHPDA